MLSASRTIRPFILVVAVAIGWGAPAFVLAQTAAVDQVLAALAEVVRDRAKQVATRTIAENLSKSLCNGKITLPPEGPKAGTTLAAGEETTADVPFAPDQPTTTTPLTLYLGGKDVCRDSYLKAVPKPGAKGAAYACDADDVFLRTCRLTKRLEVPLTDAYFLKSLSRDTVEFLMRIGARNLSAKVYTQSGLVEIGAFIHAILEQLGSKRPSPRELAEPTLALADRLSAGVPRRAFADLEPATVTTTNAKRLRAELKRAVVSPWSRAGCPPYSSKKADGTLERCAADLYDAPSCEAFEKTKGSRDKVYRTLFGKGGPLSAGRDEVCGTAFADPPDADAETLAKIGERRTNCRRARLTINLYGYLVRASCTADKSDEQARATFRELGYVVAEHLSYTDALEELAPDTEKALDAFLDDVHALDLSALPREELAAGIRVVGTYAAAVDLAPQATAGWLALLSHDLENSAQPPYETSYSRLLHGAALGTDSAGVVPGPVAALRVAVKDLLTLPALAVLKQTDLLGAASEARKRFAAPLQAAHASIHRLLDAIQHDPAAKGEFRDYVGALAAFLSDLADLTVAMGAAVEDAAGFAPNVVTTTTTATALKQLPPKGVFTRAAIAMKQGALALQLAADRDWVGLAIRVSDELTLVSGAGGDVPAEVERSLRFIRILLSMYQAASVEEAKAIFAANLEDASSRERRYNDRELTADIAALVGFNVGRQFSSIHANELSTTSNAELYGVFAPFGLQLAYQSIGFLLYPVDLGAYLSSPSGDGGSSPRWQDALRAGATLYIRPSAGIPVVVGGGVDYRPRFEGREERRWLFTLGLELPLFLLH